MAVSQHTQAPLHIAQIRRDLDLSRERMARLLDVSAKTIERWEERDALPSSTRLRQMLAQVQEIIDLGRSVYTHEGFSRFLQTPLRAAQGQTPLQLIEQDRAEQVIAALASDYEGLGY